MFGSNVDSQLEKGFSSPFALRVVHFYFYFNAVLKKKSAILLRKDISSS